MIMLNDKTNEMFTSKLKQRLVSHLSPAFWEGVELEWRVYNIVVFLYWSLCLLVSRGLVLLHQFSCGYFPVGYFFSLSKFSFLDSGYLFFFNILYFYDLLTLLFIIYFHFFSVRLFVTSAIPVSLGSDTGCLRRIFVFSFKRNAAG